MPLAPTRPDNKAKKPPVVEMTPEELAAFRRPTPVEAAPVAPEMSEAPPPPVVQGEQAPPPPELLAAVGGDPRFAATMTPQPDIWKGEDAPAPGEPYRPSFTAKLTKFLTALGPIGEALVAAAGSPQQQQMQMAQKRHALDVEGESRRNRMLEAQEARDARGAEQRELGLLAELLGASEEGGPVNYQGREFKIPGIKQKAETQLRVKKQVEDAEAEAAAQKEVLSARNKLKLMGLQPSSPEYNRNLAAMLKLPEFVQGDEVGLPGRLITVDQFLTAKGRENANQTRIHIAQLRGGGDGAGRMKTTGKQDSDVGFYSRLRAAHEVLPQLEKYIKNAGLIKRGKDTLASSTEWTRWMASEQGQMLDQLGRQWTEARLRKESGAAIPAHEFEQDRRIFLPQPGDSPAVLRRKAMARAQLLDSFAFSVGNAYANYYGEAYEPGRHILEEQQRYRTTRPEQPGAPPPAPPKRLDTLRRED